MLHDFFLQTYCFKEDISREKPCVSRIRSAFHQLFLSYTSITRFVILMQHSKKRPPDVICTQNSGHIDYR